MTNSYLLVKAGRYGTKIHRALPGFSVTMCGERAAFVVNNAPESQKCGRCFPNQIGPTAREIAEALWENSND